MSVCDVYCSVGWLVEYAGTPVSYQSTGTVSLCRSSVRMLHTCSSGLLAFPLHPLCVTR